MLNVIVSMVVIAAFVLIGLDSIEGYRGKRRQRLRDQEIDEVVVVAGPDDEVYIEYGGVVSPAARERMHEEMRHGGLVFMPPGGRVRAIRRKADATITVDGTGLLKTQLEQMKPEIRAKLVDGLNDVLRAEAARAGRAQA